MKSEKTCTLQAQSVRALHNWMLERQEETRTKTSAAMKPHNGAIIHYVESMRLFAVATRAVSQDDVLDLGPSEV